MSAIFVVTLVITTGCFLKIASALTITRDGFYDTKYNHLDIERVLNNKRLVTYYAQCLLGEGPCTPQGTEFKSKTAPPPSPRKKKEQNRFSPFLKTHPISI